MMMSDDIIVFIRLFAFFAILSNMYFNSICKFHFFRLPLCHLYASANRAFMCQKFHECFDFHVDAGGSFANALCNFVCFAIIK